MYKLRELQRDDIKTINKWRNDPELISCLGAPFRFINEEVDFRWYENYMQSRNKSIRCAIVDDKDLIVGLISLLNIDYINRSCELHIMIGESENRGKGIGTFAVKSMIDHAFDNLNLRRIELEVFEDNIPAMRLYKKCGFVREGIRREAVYKKGQYLSMIIMSILRSDYNN